MYPYKHAEITAKRLGEDNPILFFKIHNLMDKSKELEPTNAHRVFFHNMWGIRNVVVPEFGSVVNIKDQQYSIKDIGELDHVLPDFRGRFFPTLRDYFDKVEIDEEHEDYLDNLARSIQDDEGIDRRFKQYVMRPYALTGNLAALYLTLDFWFLSEVFQNLGKGRTDRVTIHPRGIRRLIKEYSVDPGTIFEYLKCEDWMCGEGLCPSFEKKGLGPFRDAGDVESEIKKDSLVAIRKGKIVVVDPSEVKDQKPKFKPFRQALSDPSYRLILVDGQGVPDVQKRNEKVNDYQKRFEELKAVAEEFGEEVRLVKKDVKEDGEGTPCGVFNFPAPSEPTEPLISDPEESQWVSGDAADFVAQLAEESEEFPTLFGGPHEGGEKFIKDGNIGGQINPLRGRIINQNEVIMRPPVPVTD